ncbi:hypothetical protein LMG24238_02968 [Paraburkholderia sediminicola]|uniref:Uncharacterized protein n=1 Tax=Paraburkholderia sediminicola TaxID=458836 RepID=A0A6J5B2V2_9BURK|nr:hypothetical protein [Paraburkholderia sediminicola]CAB3688079.1 hypothetical protein LMG24238_02968 [Paraburkholderia sediminicola]
MVNDLSPICKALISLFASTATPLTISDIETALVDADRPALRAELQMLVRATVANQAIRYADERLVYWLAGTPIEPFDGTLLHYPPTSAEIKWSDAGRIWLVGRDVTLADVGGIPRTQENQHA